MQRAIIERFGASAEGVSDGGEFLQLCAGFSEWGWVRFKSEIVINRTCLWMDVAHEWLHLLPKKFEACEAAVEVAAAFMPWLPLCLFACLLACCAHSKHDDAHQLCTVVNPSSKAPQACNGMVGLKA